MRIAFHSSSKLNHNETLSYPNTYDQTLYASVEQAFNMGAVAVGATIYFGSEESRRQIEEISAAFERAHELGMVTVLWAYLRNSAFKKDGVDYHVSADLTGQANHLAATIGADIVKQKMAENNGGYKAINYGYTDDRVYSKLTSENPIDLVRYQLANCYMGRAGLINSGGAAGGETDLSDAVRTAVINKRAGGMGLILGRKAFKKSMADGVKLINAVQDVYLDSKNYYCLIRLIRTAPPRRTDKAFTLAIRQPMPDATAEASYHAYIALPRMFTPHPA